MKAAVGEYAVHSAARPQHGAPLAPLVGLGIERLDGIGALASKTPLKSSTDDIKLAVVSACGKMISLGWQVWQLRPTVRLGIVDRKVGSAGRPPAGDVNFVIDPRGGSAAAGRRHRRAGSPSVGRRVIFINRVYEPC